MKQSIRNATLLFAAISAASPVPQSSERSVVRRWEDGVDFVTNNGVDAPAGMLYAVGSDGTDISCDEVGDLTSDNGAKCYMTEVGNPQANQVKCPGDPAPKKNPDGSDVTISESIINTFCKATGGPPFASLLGCMQFGFYEAGGDPVKESETGAMAICNTIFEGACTFFIDVAPELLDSMDKPCSDDPGSNACAFANPGK